jgi:hypothetical protein
MSQVRAQYFYCLKSERTVSGSVLIVNKFKENLVVNIRDAKKRLDHISIRRDGPLAIFHSDWKEENFEHRFVARRGGELTKLK